MLSSIRADPFSQVCQPRAPRLGARCASHVLRTGRGARVRARSATSPPPAAPGLCPTRASGAAILPAASGGNRNRKDPLPCRRPRPSRGARALARERWREEGRSEPGRGGHQDAKPATAGSPLLSFPPGFGPEIETMAFRLRCRAWAAGPNGDTWGAQPGTGRRWPRAVPQPRLFLRLCAWPRRAAPQECGSLRRVTQTWRRGTSWPECSPSRGEDPRR